MMNVDTEKKKNFRVEQSREKLKISSLMLEKELYNDSIIYSYLSMFYAVRILLIDDGQDSDDHNKILELVEEYYSPNGWTEVDIVEILHNARTFKEMLENDDGIRVSRTQAEHFNRNAENILNEVLKRKTSYL